VSSGRGVRGGGGGLAGGPGTWTHASRNERTDERTNGRTDERKDERGGRAHGTIKHVRGRGDADGYGGRFAVAAQEYNEQLPKLHLRR